MFHASNTQESFEHYAYQGSVLHFLVISEQEQAILDNIPGWTVQSSTDENQGYSCALEHKKNDELQQPNVNETRPKEISVSNESDISNILKRLSSSEPDLLSSTADQSIHPIRKLKSFSETGYSPKHSERIQPSKPVSSSTHSNSRSITWTDAKSNNECENEERISNIASSKQICVTKKEQRKSKVPESIHEHDPPPSCKKRRTNNDLEIFSNSYGQVMNGTKSSLGNSHSPYKRFTAINSIYSEPLCEKYVETKGKLNSVNKQLTYVLQMRQETEVEISKNKNMSKENHNVNINGAIHSRTCQKETNSSKELDENVNAHFQGNQFSEPHLSVRTTVDLNATKDYSISSHPSSIHMQYGPNSSAHTVTHNNIQNMQEVENSVYEVGEETQKACLGIISNEFQPSMTSQTVHDGSFLPPPKNSLNSNDKTTNPVVVHVSPVSAKTKKGQLVEDSEALPCSSELFDTSLQFSCDFTPAKRKLIFSQESSGIMPFTLANYVSQEVSQQTRSIFRFTSDEIKKMSNAIYKIYS